MSPDVDEVLSCDACGEHADEDECPCCGPEGDRTRVFAFMMGVELERMGLTFGPALCAKHAHIAVEAAAFLRRIHERQAS